MKLKPSSFYSTDKHRRDKRGIRKREEQKMLVKNWGAQRGREREACIVRGVTMFRTPPYRSISGLKTGRADRVANTPRC